ncbi:MAG: NTP transferase domain-containing protein [Bdellovibrionales bacterium]|nr:NTP transferase domain-containing protein [Bdellovibrionales bacterium]
MLLTAGFGTRLRPFTEACAKPLLPLLGVPIAQYAADLLGAAGVKSVVANAHWLLDRTEAGLKGLDWGGAKLTVTREPERILGGAGGIRAALHLFNGAFFYVNGDIVCDVDLAALGARHEQLRRSHGVKATLAVMESVPGAAGVYREARISADGERLSSFGSLKPGVRFFAGVAVLEKALFEPLPEGRPVDMYDEVLLPASVRGELGVHLHRGIWFDIGDARLWRDAHVGMLSRRLEDLPLAWHRRFGAELRPAAAHPGVFLSTDAASPPEGARWEGPSFWSGTGGAPKKLAAGTVWYGPHQPQRDPLGPGIGWGGNWVGLGPV